MLEPFLETRDLRRFAELLRDVPTSAFAALADGLDAALAQPGPGEPESEQLRRDTPLGERMRSPVAVLLRQLRLEKRRLLAEERARRG